MNFKAALVFSILAMALAFSYPAYAKNDDHKIYELSPDEIASIIKSTKGQKRIVIIYASWCPYCIKKMPKIMEFEFIKQGSVIAVSVDENYKNFKRYINKFKKIPFKVIVNDGSDLELYKSLKQFGVKQWDGVPEIILLDENNQSMGQGNYELDYVADFLFKD